MVIVFRIANLEFAVIALLSIIFGVFLGGGVVDRLPLLPIILGLIIKFLIFLVSIRRRLVHVLELVGVLLVATLLVKKLTVLGVIKIIIF